MARRRVVLQEPTSIAAGVTYDQPEKHAIQVDDAKTAVVVLDVYANSDVTGMHVFVIETASGTDPAPYKEPGSMWVSPTGAVFTIGGGTTGTHVLSIDELGDVLR